MNKHTAHACHTAASYAETRRHGLWSRWLCELRRQVRPMTRLAQGRGGAFESHSMNYIGQAKRLGLEQSIIGNPEREKLEKIAGRYSIEPKGIKSIGNGHIAGNDARATWGIIIKQLKRLAGAEA